MRFLLVDEILAMTPGKSVRAEMTMPPGETLFLDHFPGFPVVPGVLLTEMMGQAAGKCLLAEDATRGRPVLVEIKSAKFRRFVRPGEKIVLVAQIGASHARVATASCHAEVGGEKVCSADLMFAFVPPPAGEPMPPDAVLERFARRALT